MEDTNLSFSFYLTFLKEIIHFLKNVLKRKFVSEPKVCIDNDHGFCWMFFSGLQTTKNLIMTVPWMGKHKLKCSRPFPSWISADKPTFCMFHITILEVFTAIIYYKIILTSI